MEQAGQLHVTNEMYHDQRFPYMIFSGTKDGMVPSQPGFRRLHWHEALQFTLVTRGTMTMEVNGHAHHLLAGEANFINYGFLHMITDVSDDGEYISLNFPAKLLSFFPDSRMEEEYVLPYITNYALPVTILRPAVPWQKEVLDLLREIRDISGSPERFGREYLMSVRTVQMWYLLIKNISQRAERVPESVLYKQERMREMLTFIHTHYAEEILVEDIAQAAGVSAGECHRSFKNLLHVSPKDYLNEYRLDKSVELLNGTDQSITEIAGAVGYNFTSHFIASFKTRFGETPKQYRSGSKP